MDKKEILEIILVEDDEDHAHFIRRVLNKKRYNITLIKDGKQALDFLLGSEVNHDVVLLDYRLPTVDGLEILRKTKENGKDFAFIFLTVDTSVDTVVEAMKTGALDFLPKTEKFYNGLPEMIEKVFRIHIDRIEKKIAEEKIAASLKEKEILLKELHHRVKNNLQIISGLLYMQSKKVKGKKNIELFQQSQERIKAMAIVHESFYNNENLCEINFVHFVKNQISHLIIACGLEDDAIKFNIVLEDIYINIDVAIPLALILNELIMNSIKHAFPGNRKGEIGIELKKHQNTVHLSLKDNGIGLPDDFDKKETNLSGLELVRNLTEQLDGKLTINGYENSGTEIQIQFDN